MNQNSDEMEKALLLSDLPDDCLSIIFDNCSLDDLLNLFYVCKRFNGIIRQSTFLRRSFDLLLVGHRNQNAISYQRTIQNLSYHKRVKVFQNWCYGRYDEHILFQQPQFNPSKILLEKEFLYKSHSGQLRKYRRLKKIDNGRSRRKCDILQHQPVETYGEVRDADITCFTKTDGCVFLGRRNGRVKIIAVDTNDNDEMDETNASSNVQSEQRVESVDFSGELFATATLQRAALWQKHIELDMPYLEATAELGDGYKCIRLSPNADRLAMGKYKDTTRKGLHLVDVATYEVSKLASDTSSIYDIQWKDNNVILTGHYDTTFRVFDVRSNCDELIYYDPYDLAVYSISYDGNFGVLCGMKYHCRVNLYDLRVPSKYIQLYFPKQRPGAKGNSSPAYQVANDQSQLFIATDYNLRVLDFDADWAESKDYTNLFVHEMIVNVNS